MQWDDEAVRKAYEELSNRLARKYLKKAVHAAALVTFPRAFSSVPVGKTGALLGALAVRPSKTRKAAVAAAYSVGTYADGPGMFKGDQFYGGFQEYGWTPGKRSTRLGAKNKNANRKVPGKHFLKNALQATASDALSVMQRELIRGLELACTDVLKAQAKAAKSGKTFKRSSYLK